ncbi:MAG TPA: ABATE domain-containing protein [Pseudonocardia sp.]|nr:ABATE domain-containing protein [Pseudonocardia sp.]
MKETVEPTAATMRLDGGHPALDLVNTVYGQVDGPVEHDVLRDPADLVVLADRMGLVEGAVEGSEPALRAARELRTGLDALLRAQLAGTAAPPAAADRLAERMRAAYAAARLARVPGGWQWTWPPDDADTPVHRLALAAVGLLTDGAELARLRCCAGCCWLYLDHSRGSGRRWCSMADCGTNAKKRRYVQRRRDRVSRTP